MQDDQGKLTFFIKVLVFLSVLIVVIALNFGNIFDFSILIYSISNA